MSNGMDAFVHEQEGDILSSVIGFGEVLTSTNSCTTGENEGPPIWPKLKSAGFATRADVSSADTRTLRRTSGNDAAEDLLAACEIGFAVTGTNQWRKESQTPSIWLRNA
jgi:hypothetical protein